MQPATTAQATTNTINVPITTQLRDFYQNIAGTPTSQQAESDVTQFNKTAPKSADILSAYDQAYGVNDASKKVSDLRKSVFQAQDLVDNVDDNVFARTSNALVSDAQRSRLTAVEKDPLVKQLGVISRNFDVAGQDLSGLRDQSNRYSTAELGDIDTMRNSLGTRLSTSQQREQSEREAAAAAEQNRQWWANFEVQKQQFAEQQRINNANIAKINSDIANSNRTYQLQAQQSQAAAAAQQAAQQAAADKQNRDAAIKAAANRKAIEDEAAAATKAQQAAAAKNSSVNNSGILGNFSNWFGSGNWF